MRGTLLVVPVHRPHCRFIPAYAGNACCIRLRCTPSAVHPRVCGERCSFFRPFLDCGGSSPRMRGTPIPAPDNSSTERFIPAYAGNACATGIRLAPPTVHPRVCGERHRRMKQTGSRLGSSPRMRGTPQERKIAQVMNRFIPAYAGNACRLTAPHFTSSVHPRVCGERVSSYCSPFYIVGSSPRMRGTLLGPEFLRYRLRFIPAYAGNAPMAGGSSSFETVHPRVCGERSPTGTCTSRRSGSSPRMRGTLLIRCFRK